MPHQLFTAPPCPTTTSVKVVLDEWTQANRYELESGGEPDKCTNSQVISTPGPNTRCDSVNFIGCPMVSSLCQSIKVRNPYTFAVFPVARSFMLWRRWQVLLWNVIRTAFQVVLQPAHPSETISGTFALSKTSRYPIYSELGPWIVRRPERSWAVAIPGPSANVAEFLTLPAHCHLIMHCAHTNFVKVRLTHGVTLNECFPERTLWGYERTCPTPIRWALWYLILTVAVYFATEKQWTVDTMSMNEFTVNQIQLQRPIFADSEYLLSSLFHMQSSNVMTGKCNKS